MTLELYQQGDFTSANPERAMLSKKVEGFIEAGLLIEVVTRDEAQKEIDVCHIDVFGESRLERRGRIQSERSKPETKTVTRTVAVPKTKIVKQEPQQQTTPKDTERTDFTPIRPQPPLPNQQDDREKR